MVAGRAVAAGSGSEEGRGQTACAGPAQYWIAALHNSHAVHDTDRGAGLISDLVYQAAWQSDHALAGQLLIHALSRATVWGVTQSGAAAHMKVLTDIIDAPDTSFEGWTDDLDIHGIHVFACSLYLANHPESARFWWQFAAGAGHGAAAYCLHLQHLISGELREAELWWERVGDILADPAGADLDDSELVMLVEVLEHFAGYSVREGTRRALPIGGLKAEVDRLAHLDDDGLLCRPDRRLADRLRELTSH